MAVGRKSCAVEQRRAEEEVVNTAADDPAEAEAVPVVAIAIVHQEESPKPPLRPRNRRVEPVVEPDPVYENVYVPPRP